MLGAPSTPAAWKLGKLVRGTVRHSVAMSAMLVRVHEVTFNA